MSIFMYSLNRICGVSVSEFVPIAPASDFTSALLIARCRHTTIYLEQQTNVMRTGNSHFRSSTGGKKRKNLRALF